MAHTLKDVCALNDDALIAAHDHFAVHAPVGLYEYRAELDRRDRARFINRMIVLNLSTLLIVGATLFNYVRHHLGCGSCYTAIHWA